MRIISLALALITLSISILFAVDYYSVRQDNNSGNIQNIGYADNVNMNNNYFSSQRYATNVYLVGGNNGGEAILINRPVCDLDLTLVIDKAQGKISDNNEVVNLLNGTLVEEIEEKQLKSCVMKKIKVLNGKYKNRMGWVGKVSYSQFRVPSN